MQTRKIIHIDMDAFYSSIEERDNPNLRGLPIIVGGLPNSRGVVSTCSYEARKFGIHSAMSSSKAYQLCPHAIFIKPDMEKYKTVSAQIRDIFFNYTEKVEPLSLDEAFLDVTENKYMERYATKLAKKIKNEIYSKTNLTASAGISYNKFLSKVASGIKKPGGLTVITPDHAIKFLEELPIRKFFGIGEATEEKMKQIGIKTGKDLKSFSIGELINKFGKLGIFYYNIVRGIDYREVNPQHIRQSVGKETTLAKDLDDINDIIKILDKLSEKVISILYSLNFSGKTVTIKVKYSDFAVITRSETLKEVLPFSKEKLLRIAKQILINKTEAGKRKIRLIGVTVSNLNNKSAEFYHPYII